MENNNDKVAILDTTLRDGSYAINFQFSAADTALISGQLERVGVQWIEIGHGVGLNASNRGLGEAAESDEGYSKAAATALKSAKFGMFCIPGVARLEDIDMLASLGAGFVRVGTDVSKVEQSQPFIERARSLGLKVMSNFMKSYAMEPKDFARKARLSQKYGSELLYVVDSAGGMLPGDVEAYGRAVQDACDLPLGFHGHDNLGLAVANSLRAAELGFRIVDGSLQGLGRSAGNAPTEILVTVLGKAGFSSSIEPLGVMDVSEKYVRPLVRRRGVSSLDVVTGHAQFHSSYMGTIRRAASKYQIDPRLLIQALTEVDKVDAPPALVQRLAEQLQSKQQEVFTARFEFDEYFGHEQDPLKS